MSTQFGSIRGFDMLFLMVYNPGVLPGPANNPDQINGRDIGLILEDC